MTRAERFHRLTEAGWHFAFLGAITELAGREAVDRALATAEDLKAAHDAARRDLDADHEQAISNLEALAEGGE